MDAIMAVVDKGVTQRPYDTKWKYHAHVNSATGGGEDSFCASIGHVENGIAVVDLIFERRPPFSPEGTIAELSNLFKSYHIPKVTGDNFARAFVEELFRSSQAILEPLERCAGGLAYTSLCRLFRLGRQDRRRLREVIEQDVVAINRARNALHAQNLKDTAKGVDADDVIRQAELRALLSPRGLLALALSA